MNKVWGFGTATIDFRIQTADCGDDYKEKLTAQETFMLGGGAVANFLTQVSRLGARTGWLGKMGADLLGKQIISMMEDEGIDCSQAIYTNEICSPFNLAVYSGEQMRRRCGFLIPNSLNSLTEADLDQLAQAIQPGDYVMVEIGEIHLDTISAFMQRVKARNARMSWTWTWILWCNAAAARNRSTRFAAWQIS